MLKKAALTSGAVARPTSPIPPERASGEIRRKGTAVVTTFNLSCAFNTAGIKPQKSRIAAVSLIAVGLIIIVFKIGCKYMGFDKIPN
jgi:hypothetical protein